MGNLHKIRQAFNNMNHKEKMVLFKKSREYGVQFWGKYPLGKKKLYRTYYSRQYGDYMEKLKREYLDGLALGDKGVDAKNPIHARDGNSATI